MCFLKVMSFKKTNQQTLFPSVYVTPHFNCHNNDLPSNRGHQQKDSRIGWYPQKKKICLCVTPHNRERSRKDLIFLKCLKSNVWENGRYQEYTTDNDLFFYIGYCINDEAALKIRRSNTVTDIFCAIPPSTDVLITENMLLENFRLQCYQKSEMGEQCYISPTSYDAI